MSLNASQVDRLESLTDAAERRRRAHRADGHVSREEDAIEEQDQREIRRAVVRLHEAFAVARAVEWSGLDGARVNRLLGEAGYRRVEGGRVVPFGRIRSDDEAA